MNRQAWPLGFVFNQSLLKTQSPWFRIAYFVSVSATVLITSYELGFYLKKKKFLFPMLPLIVTEKIEIFHLNKRIIWDTWVAQAQLSI